jgi:hypothetical protein
VAGSEMTAPKLSMPISIFVTPDIRPARVPLVSSLSV